MAITDFISIRNLDSEAPFQGIGSVSMMTDDSFVMPTFTTTNTDTQNDSDDFEVPDFDTEESPAVWDDFPELFKQAFLLKDGDTFKSILSSALLYTDPIDSTVKSILKTALLYVRNEDGQDVIRSILNDRLSDLAFVDAVLDFGFMRVHIKGKMIEYSK